VIGWSNGDHILTDAERKLYSPEEESFLYLFRE